MPIWKIKDKTKGIFSAENPQNIGGLYFPLTNTTGKIFSWITPYLSGDIKTSVHSYLTYPTTVFDTKDPRSIRTAWLYFNRKNVLNLSSFWPTQDRISLEAGPLWHKLTRENKSHKLIFKVTNFVPEGASLEVMWIKITNKAKTAQRFTPLTSIPLFCRAQENLIDHRHVTSLLNRAYISKEAIVVKPTMNFDERGHKKNQTEYFVLSFSDKHKSPQGIFSTLDEFCGKGGSLTFPQSVYSNKTPGKQKQVSGKENIAGFKFKQYSLKPGRQLNLFVVMGIAPCSKAKKLYSRFNSPGKVYKALEISKRSWSKIFNNLELNSGDEQFDFWMKWVNLQPTLRRLFGCSFMGHFDYGKGGRGWRDLWQDLLSLVLIDPAAVKKSLIKNFEGVRIDGSNATLITPQGGFISDRNKISRVWMDHGIWPYLTTKTYIDRTGDWQILFKKAGFFKDHLLKRAKEIDTSLENSKRQDLLRDLAGRPYKASLLEHLLIQTIIPFFNIGKQGNIRLENADWNDALDMAWEKGESVAFTCMYAHNLKSLADLLKDLKDNNNIGHIDISKELSLLIDSQGLKINYSNIGTRKNILEEYFEQTKHRVQGATFKIKTQDLICDLNRKADWLFDQVRSNEWLKTEGFFNGYYDNQSRRVEGKFKKKIRMSLTSQVFPIMSGAADNKQIKRIWKAMLKNLKAKDLKAFRLNTDFEELKLDLGRAFGFSYGDKENGSVFSHMNVMLSYALYSRGFVKEGWQVAKSLFSLSLNPDSRIYPCIPEYFNLEAQGLYPYLTGSASWFSYLFITQILGVSFKMGSLIVEPRFLKEQFIKKQPIKADIRLSNKDFRLILRNPARKSWPDYLIKQAALNGKSLKFKPKTKKISFKAPALKKLLKRSKIRLEITLG